MLHVTFFTSIITHAVLSTSVSLIPGIIMISLALCADAVIGNVQEKAMKSHHASNTEVVSHSTWRLGEAS